MKKVDIIWTAVAAIVIVTLFIGLGMSMAREAEERQDAQTIKYYEKVYAEWILPQSERNLAEARTQEEKDRAIETFIKDSKSVFVTVCDLFPEIDDKKNLIRATDLLEKIFSTQKMILGTISPELSDRILPYIKEETEASRKAREYVKSKYDKKKK